jgi:quercetin dioxygenase-like cupin family protein
VLTDGEPVRVTLRAGSVFVVPQGLWHRQVARAAVTLLTATPTPTDISTADDPRSEPR